MPTIDSLQQQSKDIREQLNELKGSAEKNNKESELKEIQNKLKTLKTDIENFSTKDVSDKEKLDSLKTEVLGLDNELKQFSDELQSLNESVLSSTNQQQSTTPATTNPENGESKTMWQKTKDFVGDQWRSVWSKDQWKQQPGTNIARVVGFGVTGYALYKGVKGLWNWAFGDDKKEKTSKGEGKEKQEENEENKSFWETGRGKGLKWGSITAAAGGAIYFLGKWLHLWGDKDNPTDTDRDQVKYEAYDKFAEKPENKETVENYEEFGANVDLVYEKINKKELDAGYQDELAMDRISKERAKGGKKYLGIVPFCLDNKFGTIEGVLSQNTSIKNALAGGIKSMVSYIKGLGNDFLKVFADSYLSMLPSWTGMKFVGNNLSEQVDKWIASNAQAEKELQYFFRQSIRVQTYLQEKKEQLEDKIASEKAAAYGISKKDILDNDENHEEYVSNDAQFSSFLSSSIANGSIILKNNGIFDGTIGKDVQDTVNKLDEQRAEIVGGEVDGKDILQRIYEKEGKDVSDTEKQQLAKSCDNIIKDVDGTIKDAVKASAWNTYGDLFSSDDSAIREYWKKSGLEDVFNRYKAEIGKGKAALMQGNLNSEQIKALAESVNNMLALKKEAVLGRECIQKDRDENGNIIFRVPAFLWGSLTNLYTSLGKLADGELGEFVAYFTSGYLGCGWIIYGMGSGLKSSKNRKCRAVGGLIEWTVGLPIKVPKWLGEKTINKLLKKPKWNRRLNKIKYGTSSWINYVNLFRDDSGPENLVKVLSSGEIDLAEATKILKYKSSGSEWKVWRDTFKLRQDTVPSEKILKEHLFNKLLDSLYDDQCKISDIRKNSKLYDDLIEYYDQSAELREALSNEGDIAKLENVVNKHKELVKAARERELENAANVVDDIVDEVKPNASILDDISYKQLSNKLDNELKQLEDALTGEGLSDVEKKSISKQISELKQLKNKINSVTSPEDMKVLKNLYDKFSDFSHGDELIRKMDLVTTLLNEKNPGLNQAIKEMDWEKLIDAVDVLKKEGKLSAVTDDVLTPLLDVFDVVEAAGSTGSKSKVFNTLQAEMLNLYKDFKIETNGAKRLQIINQIRDIKKWKAKVKSRVPLSELSSLENIFSLFSKAKQTRKLFSNLDTFSKLLSEGGDEVEMIFKNMNFSELKNLKASGKLSGISDDALESVTKILGDIKVKNGLIYGDEILQGMKNLLKLVKSVKNL